jgi:FtsP/CotA-like multicopper oxidase with cupredoxin domain
MRIGRREFFRFGSLGAGLGLLAGLAYSGTRWWSGLGSGRMSNEIAGQNRVPPEFGIDCATETASPDSVFERSALRSSASAVSSSAYAARYTPPEYSIVGSRDALHTPPPQRGPAGSLQEIDLPVIEATLEVANGRNVRVWTYGGTVPGPILRATVGDALRVTLKNHSAMAHNVHFHGAHDVMQDGLGPVGAGETQLYEFTAGPVGLHPYHCHVPPYAWHVGKGLYGSLIVDPVGGRPPAHEFVLCLCGFDSDGSGRNDIYAWNGVAGYYARFPLKVPVGELVRLYLTNMVEHDPVASFHLHAHTFDVYRSGTSLTPHEHTDIVSLGPAERAIIEFRLPRRGRYMFHPHQSHMAEKGAMGWIVAI